MITSVYEKKILKRLEEKNIVIETIYTSLSRNKKFVKASDGLMDEKISNCRIKEKRFFYKKEYLDRITNYPNELIYTINEYNDENEIIKCPNCGREEKVKACIDGCPYCHTNFNFGINNTYASNRKFYAFDFYNFNIILYSIVIPIAFIIVYLLYNIFDINLASLFYILCIVVIPLFIFVIKKINTYRVKIKNIDINESVEFLKTDEEKNKFYSDIYTELVSVFFSDEYRNTIDFDILNFEKIVPNNEIICCDLLIRIVNFENEHISIEKKKYHIIIVKNKLSTNENKNYMVVNCPFCGSSTSLDQRECNYCKRLIPKHNKWIISEIKSIN